MKLTRHCEKSVSILLTDEIIFLEIGVDKDHVHFLVQSVPMYSPKKIVQMIKDRLRNNFGAVNFG